VTFLGAFLVASKIHSSINSTIFDGRVAAGGDDWSRFALFCEDGII